MKDTLSPKLSDNLAHDVPAALVVFLVALPLCLGIALASGAPLFSGLIAGVIGGIVAGSLSKSSLSVSGPAAGLATIVFSSIQQLGSFPLFLMAVALAGLFQLALGYMRAGTIGHFFPVSVIKGMLSAIGLILILKQIPHALGYDADYEGDESFFQSDQENTFTEILRALDFLTPGAIIASFAGLMILIMWERPFMKRMSWTTFLPAPLLVVSLGILLNILFKSVYPDLAIQDSHLVNLNDFNGIGSLGSIITFPDLSGLGNPIVYQVALTIALVASIESLLSIEATDKLDPFRRITPLNAELKAQGVANVVSGMLGGLPVTAVIVRSSANVQAGGRTKASAILHGIFLAIVVIGLPSLLQQIPLSSLAAVLLVVGYKLNKPSMYREVYRKGLDQFLPFLVTIAAILFSDLLIGISIGILVALFFVLKTNFNRAMLVVKHESQILIRFTKDASFMHKAALRKAFEKIPHDSTVLIDATRCQFIDADIIETIEDFIKSAPAGRITVTLQKSRSAANPMFKQTE